MSDTAREAAALVRIDPEKTIVARADLSRFVGILGRVPGGHGARGDLRDPDLSVLLDGLEADRDNLVRILADYEGDRLALNGLRRDVAAVRRVFGTVRPGVTS